jgi:hypothetical protein
LSQSGGRSPVLEPIRCGDFERHLGVQPRLGGGLLELVYHLGAARVILLKLGGQAVQHGVQGRGEGLLLCKAARFTVI